MLRRKHPVRSVVWLLITSIALLLLGSVAQTRIVFSGGLASQTRGRTDVKYSVRVSSGARDLEVGAIIALEEGKTYTLAGESRQDRETGYFKTIYGCKLIDQGDFDNKGSHNALVLCVGHLFILSANGSGRFDMTGAFGGGFRDQAVVERWKGRWSVVATHDELGFMSVDEDGMGRDETDEPVKERFIFEAGKAVVVETNHPELKSIAEMRNANLWKEDVKTVEYDLDGDGKPDVIKGEWLQLPPVSRASGFIRWSVRFANGREFASPVACWRIGVLETRTNGVHDLVCGLDIVLHWAGDEYKKISQEAMNGQKRVPDLAERAQGFRSLGRKRPI